MPAQAAPSFRCLKAIKMPIHQLTISTSKKYRFIDLLPGPEFLRPTDATFLKIDVQGFEKQVMAGGQSTLNDKCVGMQLELSIVPLYEGGMLVREALDFAYSLGFTLTGLLPGFTDPRNGQILQLTASSFARTIDRKSMRTLHQIKRNCMGPLEPSVFQV